MYNMQKGWQMIDRKGVFNRDFLLYFSINYWRNYISQEIVLYRTINRSSINAYLVYQRYISSYENKSYIELWSFSKSIEEICGALLPRIKNLNLNIQWNRELEHEWWTLKPGILTIKK